VPCSCWPVGQNGGPSTGAGRGRHGHAGARLGRAWGVLSRVMPGLAQWTWPVWKTICLLQASFASCNVGPLFLARLKSQVNLQRLDISNASINDRLPDWFSNTFSKVTFLDISTNNQI
jgi:hypothetical protein